jgi:hypothetical protein
LSQNFSFVLNKDDPNFEQYASSAEDINQPIRYYINQSEILKNDEKATLSVDYSHLSSFKFSDQLFMDKLCQEYSRYEPYLRQAVT